ncbi:MAG: CDP-diacylglycerol--glycerol-3-phosphate 3-phosphatidyltransferase [Pseudomonadota bacterium]
MIWTLPNILTLARIVAAPLVALMVALGGPAWAGPAFLLFLVAALTDYLDGWLARRLDQRSALGTMLDPIADKVMVVLVLAALMAHEHNRTFFFLGPALAILMREVLISGLREYLGDVKLPVTRIAKMKTAVQLVALGGLLLGSALAAGGAPPGVERLGTGILWLAAGLTVLSGWEYFRQAMPHLGGDREAGP